MDVLHQTVEHTRCKEASNWLSPCNREIWAWCSRLITSISDSARSKRCCIASTIDDWVAAVRSLSALKLDTSLCEYASCDLSKQTIKTNIFFFANKLINNGLLEFCYFPLKSFDDSLQHFPFNLIRIKIIYRFFRGCGRRFRLLFL